MKARINGKEINRANGTFIVLEGGPTHFGLESAKRLVELAAESKADAIKFQYLEADRLVSDKSMTFSYEALRFEAGKEVFYKVEEPLYDILKRRELKKEEWIELKKYCDDKNIIVFLTATFPDEVDFIVDVLRVDSIKIASADVSELDFIKYCAKKGVNIQLDTGNADLWEIERAVIAAEEEGCDNIIIHLCPTGYPARLESINLNMISLLKKMFPNHSVAFSDHSPGWDIDIAAVALGADMVEKTITLDRTIVSCEHSFSLEKEDSIKFVKSIRDVEKALGSERRVLPEESKIKRKAGRRSAHLKKDVKKGESIKIEDVEFRRPGFGISSSDFKLLEGKKVNTDLKNGEILKIDYFG